MASFVASLGTMAAKKAYNVVAKDRNILIPLDEPQKTKLLSDHDIKKQFCTKEVRKPNKDVSKELIETKNKLANANKKIQIIKKELANELKAKKATKAKKSNLERVLERL